MGKERGEAKGEALPSPSPAYYQRKRKEGKTHNHALRCLANIWVKIITILWKKRECYSEEKRLASIGKHALYNKKLTTQNTRLKAFRKNI